MKKFTIIIYIFLSGLVFSQNINIQISPVISTTSYSNVNFNELLNYGIRNINSQTTKPDLKFGFGIKPGVNLKLNYNNFNIGGSFYMNNSFTGPMPIAQRYNADGSEAHNSILGENHKMVSMEKSKYRIIENENNFYVGYNLTNNFSSSILLSNYTLNVNKADLEIDNYPDSVKLDIFEKINSLGVKIEYQYKFLRNFYFFVNAGMSYIYNFKEISRNIFISINTKEFVIHNYKGYGYKFGIKLQWKTIFFSYDYLQLQTEKNYFANSSHKFELGISLEALSINPNKLFGE